MEWMNIRKVGNLLYNFHFGDANRSENTDDFDINICVEGVQVSKLNVEHYQTYSSSIADLHLRHDDYGPDFIWRYTDPDNVKTMTPLSTLAKDQQYQRLENALFGRASSTRRISKTSMKHSQLSPLSEG